MVRRPYVSTLRRLPLQPGTALVMADLGWVGGDADVGPSPRAILTAQRERLAREDLVAYAGTELEFIVFDDSFRAAWAKKYAGLTPSTRSDARRVGKECVRTCRSRRSPYN